jgi:hypothetical protein
VNFDTFCPAPKAPGGRKPEIHNSCPPCPKDASIKFEKKIGAVVIKKKLKMF